MKLLVLGHSDSDGSKLADRADGWPWVLQRLVHESAGVELEVVHKLLFAGPTAVGYLKRQVEEEQPAIVVLATSTYGVVVQLASNRVRKRFGERAAHFVNRGEVQAAHLSRRLGPRGKSALMAARHTARRIIGTSPAFSFDALVACYEDCVRTLASYEDIHSIVLGGLGYGTELQRLNPRMYELQDLFHGRIRELTLEHHLDWLMHEEILGGREAKLKYYLPDAVHSNEDGQRMVAEAAVPLVLAQLS